MFSSLSFFLFIAEKTGMIFHTIPIRFCSRFLMTVKMAHCMEIDKIKSFLRKKKSYSDES